MCAPLYLLGILNSQFMDWYYKTVCLTNKASIAQIKKVHLDQLPMQRAEGAEHDRMVALVSNILELHQQRAVAKSEAQKDIIQRQIDATDAEIDRLVYNLYALTPEEIAIVEAASTGI